ncbi:MAG: helix-turn-helix domain-containing protein [Verrucomicrobiales bacterium]
MANPIILGEHLKNQRILRGLSIVAAGRLMETDQQVLGRWEVGHRDPSVEVWPRILKFLGYSPYPTAGNISAQVLMLRRIEGASTTIFGRRFGSNATTVKRWETGHLHPHPRALPIIEEMLAKAKIPALEASSPPIGA